MQRIFFILLMLLPSEMIFSQEKVSTKVGPIEKEVLTIDDSYPDAFIGQKIQVYDKSGKPQGEFDRTKWRIVPRDKKVVYRQTATRTVDCSKQCDKEKASGSGGYTPVFKKHTIGLLLGDGKTGLTTRAPEDENLEVTQDRGLIFGAQYQYHWDEDWSFSGVVTSNSSVMAGAHYSFNL